MGKWRHRFLKRGVEGLCVCSTWSFRLMAEEEGASMITVQPWFSLFAVKPHCHKIFKLSNSPL